MNKNIGNNKHITTIKFNHEKALWNEKRTFSILDNKHP